MKVTSLSIAFIVCSILQTVDSQAMIPGRNFNGTQNVETMITLQLIDDSTATHFCIKSVALPLKQIALCQTLSNCLATVTQEEPLILFSSSIVPEIFDVVVSFLNQLDTQPATRKIMEDIIIENLECFALHHLIPLLDAACHLDCPLLYDLFIFLAHAKIEEYLFKKNNPNAVLVLTKKIEETIHNNQLFKHVQSTIKNKLSVENLALSYTNFSSPDFSKVTTRLTAHDALLVLNKGTSSISLTDFYTQKLLAAIDSNNGMCNSAYLSGNGEKIASTTWENCIRIWDVLAPDRITEISAENCFFDSICLSYDGAYCASAKPGDSSIFIWETATGNCICTIPTNFPINALCFVSQSLTLALVTSNHTIVLIDTNSGSCIGKFRGHKDTITGICFSPDNDTIISSSRDDSIKIWDIQTGKCLQTIVSSNPLESIHCTSDNTLIAIISTHNSIQAISLMDVNNAFTLSSLLFLDYMLEKKRTNSPFIVNNRTQELYTLLPQSYKNELKEAYI